MGLGEELLLQLPGYCCWAMGLSEDGTPSDDTICRKGTPPVGDPVGSDHKASQHQRRWRIGHEQNVGTDHQCDESEQLEHWLDTVGRWGFAPSIDRVSCDPTLQSEGFCRWAMGSSDQRAGLSPAC